MDNLPGQLGLAEGELYLYTLTGADGQLYALLGATPQAEAELGDWAPLRIQVAVSGTLEPDSPITDLPLIVVESVTVLDGPEVQPATPTPSPSPAFSVPERTIVPRATAVTTPAPSQTAHPPAPGDVVRGTPTPLLLPTAPPQLPSPTATLVPERPAGPRAVVTAFAVNVRKGPGGDYAFVGVVRRNSSCIVIGRVAEADWLLLACPELTGWVRVPFLEVDSGLDRVPLILVAPPDTAEPDPTAIVQPPFVWRGLAYTNRTLSGSPAVGFDTPVIDFNWGQQAPLASFPVDNFSIRFDATPRFAPGDYLFSLTYDDGARLTIAGDVVINDWTEGAARTSYWQGRLNGDVPISVEYFEAYHDAIVRLTIERLLPVPILPTPLPTPVAPGPLPTLLLPEGEWLATYFANLEQTGLPTLTRLEPADDTLGANVPLLTARVPLERDWGRSSPAPAVLGLEGWSARWQGQFRFAAGAQQFEVVGSGRVLVYLDNILIAAGDLSAGGATLLAEATVNEGRHALVIEFADTVDEAAVRVRWLALDSEPIQFPVTATPESGVTLQPAPTRAPALPGTPMSPRTPVPTPQPTATPVGK